MNFGERFLDRLRGGIALHAGLQHERAAAPPEVESGPGAVSKPLLLAQLHVDAADELSAENGIHHQELRVVGRTPPRGEMTQAELADRVDVTRQTIIAIEQGKYSPSLEVAFRIAAVFGVPLDDVFQYDGKGVKR